MYITIHVCNTHCVCMLHMMMIPDIDTKYCGCPCVTRVQCTV